MVARWPCKVGVPVALLLFPTLVAYGQENACRIDALPERVVENRDFEVTVAYQVARGEARLNCELKNAQHIVLQGERATVAGAGSKTFTLTAPAFANAKQLSIAVWLGEDWRRPLAPIVTSIPIRVVTEAMADLDGKRKAEAPALLRQLSWQRSPQGNIAILRDEIPGLGANLVKRYEEALGKSGAHVTPLTGEQLANSYILSTDHFDMLLLVNATVFPGPAIESLTRFLEAGGDLIAIGAPAFERLVTRVEGEWMDRERYLARLAQTRPTRILLDFEAEESPALTRGTDRQDSATAVETTSPGASGTGKALHVRISDLRGWDTLRFEVPEGGFPEGSDLTCFRAKGGPSTTQLALEWVEQDGSRWIATVPLAREWRPYALRPSDFRYWRDNPSEGRGGPGDVLKPGNVRSLSIGLAITHTQVSPGEHEYWIDQIGTAPDPFAGQADWQPVDPPVLDTISPTYKLYEVTAPIESLDMTAGRALLGDVEVPVPQRMLSCHPRPQGTGFRKQRKWRWVPLVQAHAKGGGLAGTLATLLIHGTAPYSGGLWASITSQRAEYAGIDSVVGAVARLAGRMLDGVFLYEGGAEYYAYFDGESVRLGATVANFGRAESGPLSVKITVRPEGNEQALFEKELDLAVSPDSTQAVETVWERGEAPGSDYSVTTQLYRDGKPIDALEHPLGIWRPKRRREYMTARDGDFYLGNRKWYPYGVNYMPSSECGIEDNEYFEYWLDPQPYDPVVTERDLERIKQIGFNMVSVFVYYRSIDSRNLLDLLLRCEKHGLKVNLSLRPGTPLDFRWPEIGEIITRYRLAEMDSIFAYDLAWEPMFRGYEQRKRWDREWEKWVAERYGSIGNAEQDWGVPIPRADGAVTSPSDQQVSSDGEWRVMVVAYRRFLDDLLSKAHLRAVQRVRTVDPHHLLSFRMTIAGDPTASASAMAYDFRGLAKSMQIMQPEAYGRIGDWQRILPGWFTDAYSRYTAPGRPVMWAEFGYSVWDGATMDQSESRLDFAARFYRDFLTMVLKSGGNGTVCWFYPGGYRWNERSDFGIINPDGTWREVTRVLHEFAPRMTEARDRPEPDVWFEVDRDADARGLQGIWAAVGDPFLQAIEEGHFPALRGGGEGLTSAVEPVVAVGNRPYDGHNAPKYLNAEFNYLEVKNARDEWVRVEEDGQEVHVSPEEPVFIRASIGNNGWATWLSPTTQPDEPGGVYLTTTDRSALTFRQPIPEDVPRFGDAVVPAFAVEQQILEPTTLECVLLAQDRATFGERLEVLLAPQR